MVECRTRDPEVPSSNPGVGKKKISHRSNQNNTTTNLPAPEFNTWNCQRWKLESLWHRVEFRTRDPEVPSSNPGVDKKKISHRSNQNNTTTNPSAPDFNTWNCQRWKPEVAVAQWWSAGLEIQRCPFQTLVWAKWKSLTGPIRKIPPPISEVEPRSHCCTVWSAGLEIQRSPVQTLVWTKWKSLTGPIRTIPPPIPLHQSSIPESLIGENQKSLWYCGRVQD